MHYAAPVLANSGQFIVHSGHYRIVSPVGGYLKGWLWRSRRSNETRACRAFKGLGPAHDRVVKDLETIFPLPDVDGIRRPFLQGMCFSTETGAEAR